MLKERGKSLTGNKRSQKTPLNAALRMSPRQVSLEC
jgi:hypothetical protein